MNHKLMPTQGISGLCWPCDECCLNLCLRVYALLYFFLNGSNATFPPLESRFETVDMAVRLLIPIIVLQNHNRYNILQEGHNYSIDVQAIEREVGVLFLHEFLSEAT